MANLRKQSVDARANKLRASLGMQGIPVPVDKIAKSLGARVRFSPLDDELSGFIYIKDGVPIIGVNSLHHPNRQRFTIAHEIAHLQLHPDFITSAVHVDKQFAESVLKRDAVSATGTERLEVEANQFAAALLMPGDILDELLEESPIDIEDESIIEEWATEFLVSKAALQYRIRNL
ncbi:MAG: ImmA/IrrE family metallo-endopeptidase [Candidatus Acidiferrales bacterium]